MRRPSDLSIPWTAMIAFALLGNSAMSGLPMLLGGMVDRLRFTLEQAGFISALEMGGFAFGMFVLIWIVPRVDRRPLALAAVTVLILSNLLSMLASSFALMAAVRFISGFGAAMSYSMFLTLGARTEMPQRVFAIVNATSQVFTGLFTLSAPRILIHFGLDGLFEVKIIMAVAVGLAVMSLPPGGRGEHASRTENVSRGDGKTGRRMAIALVLATLAVLYIGHGAVWAYQERIGVAKGLLREDVGTFLGISVLIPGVMGSLAAAALALRLGWVWPQLISLILSIIAALLLVFTSSLWGFGIACALVASTWYYGLPYQMGLLAEFDPRGRANLAGSMVITCGVAIGPAAAAIILGLGQGYVGIGLMGGICYILALAFVLPAALAVESKRTQAVGMAGNTA